MKALDGGAAGFIPKSASRDVMVSALGLIFSGGIYIPAEVFADRPAPASPKVRPGLRSSPADLGLTDRQIEVLALLMQGKSNKAICRTLGLAEHTVKNYVTAILKALNVTNRTEAVIAVGALGWDLPPVSTDSSSRRGRMLSALSLSKLPTIARKVTGETGLCSRR